MTCKSYFSSVTVSSVTTLYLNNGVVSKFDMQFIYCVVYSSDRDSSKASNLTSGKSHTLKVWSVVYFTTVCWLAGTCCIFRIYMVLF